MSEFRERADEAAWEAAVEAEWRTDPADDRQAALAPLTRGTHERRGTVEELWEMRIAEGECPRGSCVGRLDDEGYCSLCGFSLTEHRMRTRLASIEDKPDYVATIPGALQLDDSYAPAQLDEGEAA